MVDLTQFAESYAPWGLALLAVWVGYGLVRLVREAHARRRRDAFIDAAAGEPVTLHPVIDPARCVGCSACTNACPEGRIIAMIGGKAQLIDPVSCIGHGACKTACPVSAIDLVFGSARRGVDIPALSPTFESSVPGVFIAGELGGMGLIANAIEQGRQAIDSIARLDGLKKPDRYDVVIIGAGPAGIAASLAAKEKGLGALTLEQDSLGGTVARYPRGKIAMTRPAHLPLYGRVKFRRVRKERLLTLWDDIVRKTGIVIHDRVRVDRIIKTREGFDVASSGGTFPTRAVLLATGRRGAPRRLGVPGEERSKVVYGLGEPGAYRGKHVLVVGGGDSALEAAASLTRDGAESVTLAVRGAEITRARPAARQRLETARQSGRLTVLLSTRVERIEAQTVHLVRNGRAQVLANDAVIVCAGGTLPTALLAGIGVAVETHFGTV